LKYYSVDRRGFYVEGANLELTHNPATTPGDIFEHIHQMHPEGYSWHGMQYYRDAPAPAVAADAPMRFLQAAGQALSMGNAVQAGQFLNSLHAAMVHSRSQMLDLLLERTRAAFFPDRPSRYQSVFAVESLDEALAFRAAYGAPEHPVYEVLPLGKSHRGDMAVYTAVTAASVAMLDYLVHLYWRGETWTEPNHKPQWEHVLELPVAVVKKVA
jgi:hypothetical protein